MRIMQAGLLAALVLVVTRVVAADDVVPPDAPSRIEVIPIQTLTITDEQF
jgi:hypothetical protein